MSEIFTESLSSLAKALKEKKISVKEATQSCLDRMDATEPKLHTMLFIDKDAALKKAAELDQAGPDATKPLWGVPVTVKDALVTKGMPSTAASRILEGFMSPYDAFAVEKLREAGSVLLGKNNMDEFAMGSTTENSAYQTSHNPRNIERVPGGSSGGSAASVAAGQCFASLGSDTGGSIRQPASFCGCVGMKPSYGRVSRYGLIAYGSSLDQIGPLTRTVEDCARVLQVIAGHDERDMTSSPLPVQDYLGAVSSGSLKGRCIAIPKEYFGDGLSDEVRAVVENAIAQAKAEGCTIKEVSLPHTEAAIATYYIIAMAEASSNLARFDGVRYGHRTANAEGLQELYTLSRKEGFGEEVKRRILLGTYVLSSGYYDAYYRKAAQVRRLIRDEFNQVLEGVDCILAPVSPVVAWPLGSHAQDPLQLFLMDAYTCPVNLAGIPSISLPAGLGSSGMPVGIQLIGRAFDEAGLFGMAAAFESVLPKLDIALL